MLGLLVPPFVGAFVSYCSSEEAVSTSTLIEKVAAAVFTIQTEFFVL